MFNIPTIANLVDAHLARLEGEIDQDSPLNDRAFLRVLANTEGAEDAGLYKYIADRAKANLALTAKGEDLENIGNNKSTPRKQAQAAVLTATLPATTGTIIKTSDSFIADANQLRYRPIEDAIAVANVATITLKCIDTGADGNLEISDTLQIGAPVAGAETVATVTAVVTLGTDIEDQEVYRQRVLFAYRAVTGGANATDHKIWSEGVTGVRRAFPYAGRPAIEGTSYPGDRQVYVECTSDIDSDGIPPQAILDEVREAIGYNIATGAARPPLGITDDRLWVEPIFRTGFYIEIRNFSVDSSRESDCKAALTAAFRLYFDNAVPFVDGIDLVQNRMDQINTPSVSSIGYDVLRAYGASASSIGFGTIPASFLSEYNLGMGELVKLITPITYT